jgi:acetyltransferase-like isoleucine patch superfamily enzyme
MIKIILKIFKFYAKHYNMIKKIITRFSYGLFYIFLTPKFYAKLVGVKIGNNCRIVSKNFGSEPYLIEIGNHVHITKGVNFITHDGAVWVFRDIYPELDMFGKIIIEDNTYIGNNATILPGVCIGRNCIVGANSVVTKSIPDNCVVAGNPAKYITSTESFLKKALQYNARTKNLDYSEKKKFLLSKEFNLFVKKKFLNIEK